MFQQQEAGGDASTRDQNQNHARLTWCSSQFHKLVIKIQGAPSPFIMITSTYFGVLGFECSHSQRSSGTHVTSFPWSDSLAVTFMCPFLSPCPSPAGIPPLADHSQLELTVVYNACVCSIARSQFSEAELLLTQATERRTEDQTFSFILVWRIAQLWLYQFLSSTVLRMKGDGSVASDRSVFWRTALKSLGNTALDPCVLYLLCLQWTIWLATCQLKTIQGFQVRCYF